jgi:hypothetical protein
MLGMQAFLPAIIPSLLAIGTKEQDIHPKQLTNPNLDNCNTDILPKIEIIGLTQALLQHCEVNKVSNTLIELLLDPAQTPRLNKKQEERINLGLSKYYNAPVTVNIKLDTMDMNTPTNIKKRYDTKKT